MILRVYSVNWIPLSQVLCRDFHSIESGRGFINLIAVREPVNWMKPSNSEQNWNWLRNILILLWHFVFLKEKKRSGCINTIFQSMHDIMKNLKIM